MDSPREHRSMRCTHTETNDQGILRLALQIGEWQVGHHLGGRHQARNAYAIDEEVFFNAATPGGDYGCCVVPENLPRMELILVISGEKNQGQRGQGNEPELPRNPRMRLRAR